MAESLAKLGEGVSQSERGDPHLFRSTSVRLVCLLIITLVKLGGKRAGPEQARWCPWGSLGNMDGHSMCLMFSLVWNMPESNYVRIHRRVKPAHTGILSGA